MPKTSTATNPWLQCEPGKTPRCDNNTKHTQNNHNSTKLNATSTKAIRRTLTPCKTQPKTKTPHPKPKTSESYSPRSRCLAAQAQRSPRLFACSRFSLGFRLEGFGDLWSRCSENVHQDGCSCVVAYLQARNRTNLKHRNKGINNESGFLGFTVKLY